MLEVDLSGEDLAAVKETLLQWRSNGVETPLLPTGSDFNDDGIVDAYGLSDSDDVVVVLGVPISDTVYEAVGDKVAPNND